MTDRSEDDKAHISRRVFLGTGAAAGAATIIPGGNDAAKAQEMTKAATSASTPVPSPEEMAREVGAAMLRFMMQNLPHHAQGVAFAAQRAAAPCRVMVIDTAPEAKVQAIERLGATIVSASYDECWRVVEQHEHDRLPGHFVHPFDNDQFISGNGTIGLELLDQLPAADAIVASVGGGGLLVGIATAARALKPSIRIYSAEPETAAPLATSLAKGEASNFPGWQASFVDGCGGKSVTPTMWPLLRDAVDAAIVVSLDEVRRAMCMVAAGTRVIAEGAGACAVAAALSGRAGSGVIIAVVSGGNIDAATFARIVAADHATGHS